MAKALRLITFDLTGTLMDFRIPVVMKYVECAKKLNIQADPDTLSQNLALEWNTLSKQHPNFGRDTGLGCKSWWTRLVVNSFKATVPHTNEALLSKLAESLIKEYKTDSCWKLADGALHLLNLLKEKDVCLGIISNYDDSLETVLRCLAIHSYFDVIVSSYQAGFMKPDKRIFDYTLNQLGKKVLHPANCLHVGNSIEFDYIGALNAGWRGFYIRSSKNALVNSSHTFNSLNELNDNLLPTL